MSEKGNTEEEAECSDEYPDRVNTLKVSDTKRKNYVLSSSRVLSFGTASAEKKKKTKKNKKRETKMCVGDFFASGRRFLLSSRRICCRVNASVARY